MATIITIVAVAAAVVAAAINGISNNSKFDSHKSNFKIECDSLVF